MIYYKLVDYIGLIKPSTVNTYYINENIEVGNFVKLSEPFFKLQPDWKNHIFMVKKINTINDYGYVYIEKEYKIVNITLKEKTGFDYCIVLFLYDIKKDKKTERLYKIKKILNDRQTDIQEQREPTLSNREQRILELPFSCD